MKGPAMVYFPPNVTLKRLRPLQIYLENLVDDPAYKEIMLVGQNVVRVDTAGLQLLSAFCVAARSAGKVVTWKDPSQKLCTAAEILGLEHAMGFSRRFGMTG